MSPLGLIVIYLLKIRVYFDGNRGILELVGGGCLEEGIYHEVKNEFGSSSFALSFRKLDSEHGVSGTDG